MISNPLHLAALSEAWRAWVEGSFPVGAVVSRSNEVLATGCNHIYAAGRDLAGSGLAHAEIDVLRKLDTEAHDDLLLTSTLEPCPMCMGAVYVKRIGSLEYLAPDPYGGASDLPAINPLVQRYRPTIVGPHRGAAGRVARTLTVAWLTTTGRWPSTLDEFTRQDPAHAVGVRNDLAGFLAEAADRGSPFSEVLPLL